MALVAWLLLVVTPVFGIPAEITGTMHQTEHTTSSNRVSHHCDHTAPAKADPSSSAPDDDCCSDDECGCGTNSNSALGLPIIRELANSSVAGVCWSPQDVTIPSSDFTPPLRPPAD
jgi:hypothetical protein